LVEPGVGKSVIVEGLALRIVQRKVSRVLYNKRICILDLGSNWLLELNTEVNLKKESSLLWLS
jgi:ATP-dependent Clp protease ATP-binding subunit ClpA